LYFLLAYNFDRPLNIDVAFHLIPCPSPAHHEGTLHLVGIVNYLIFINHTLFCFWAHFLLYFWTQLEGHTAFVIWPFLSLSLFICHPGLFERVNSFLGFPKYYHLILSPISAFFFFISARGLDSYILEFGRSFSYILIFAIVGLARGLASLYLL
jgi:hypothetical protein